MKALLLTLASTITLGATTVHALEGAYFQIQVPDHALSSDLGKIEPYTERVLQTRPILGIWDSLDDLYRIDLDVTAEGNCIETHMQQISAGPGSNSRGKTVIVRVNDKICAGRKLLKFLEENLSVGNLVVKNNYYDHRNKDDQFSLREQVSLGSEALSNSVLKQGCYANLRNGLKVNGLLPPLTSKRREIAVMYIPTKETCLSLAKTEKDKAVIEQGFKYYLGE